MGNKQPLHCGHFWPFSKCSHFSNISRCFEPFFAQTNSNVFVETFFACFRQFYSFTQTGYFAWAIAFALWPFLAILKMLSYFDISCFFEPFFAQNNSNVLVQTGLPYFRQFYFLNQIEYFAWAIAFALWPFLAIFKMLSFFEYQLLFRAVFLHRPTLMCLQRRVSHVLGNFIF